MLRQSTSQYLKFVLTLETTNSGSPSTSAVHTGDGTVAATICKEGGGAVSTTNAPIEIGSGIYAIQLSATETDTIGELCVAITYNTGANVKEIRELVISPAAYDGGGLDAAGIRTAVGLAAASLDTQLAAILAAEPTATSIRAAIGEASANLDTQLAALSTLTAAGIRAAIGEASSNLDTQLAAILAAEPTATSIRAAVGLAAASLDTQLAAILAAEPTATSIRAAVGLAAASLDTQLAGITPLNAAGIRAAVGLTNANLDTQLQPLTQVNAIATAVGRLPNVPAAAGDAMNLTVGYDKAKTAAQPGDAMNLTVGYDKAKTAAQPGDAMTLTPAYDAAKTCAQPGQAVTLGGSNLNALGASLATLAQLPGIPWYLQQQLKICAQLLEVLP